MRKGDRLGKYILILLLGKGGSSEVWRAEDEETGKAYALKVYADSPHEPSRRRFANEFTLLKRVQSENVVTAIDFFEHDGRPCIVLENLGEQSLEDRIHRGPLTQEQLRPYAIQAAAALEALHRQGLAHRDIKPGHLMLTEDGTLKVIDLGMAAVIRPPEGTPVEQFPTVTLDATMLAGTIVGTPGYMSPEQARGEQADERSDVFSLCATLYEALTQKRPFRGSTISSILKATQNPKPAWPDSIRREADPELLNLIEKGLNLDPAQRPSASAFRAALEKFERRTWSKSQRKTLILGATFLAAAALVVLIGSPPSQVRHEAPEPVNAAKNETVRQVTSTAVPLLKTAS